MQSLVSIKIERLPDYYVLHLQPEGLSIMFKDYRSLNKIFHRFLRPELERLKVKEVRTRGEVIVEKHLMAALERHDNERKT